jgi:8-oxo-dGTP diphosphatase
VTESTGDTPVPREDSPTTAGVEPLDVVGAVIVRGEKILAARRGRGKTLAGLWEFPGGKVELDESHEESLRREISEELGCSIAVGARIATANHDYEFARIRLTTYYATIQTGHPSAVEHSQLRWISVSDLQLLQWAPADVPTVHALLQRET